MSLLGKGYLAFTVDQGADMERYQGIVELTGEHFQESVQHYFAQSEQILTGLRFALGRDAEGLWRAGCIMIQRLPEERGMAAGEAEEDDWRRVMVLLQSCKDEELLDPNLSQNDLLFRLFHEDGIRVQDPLPVHDACRCSAVRAENILRALTPEDRNDMTVDGKLVVKCEFCNRVYDFEPGALTASP
jgi:molecular chaperone Hsp33